MHSRVRRDAGLEVEPVEPARAAEPPTLQEIKAELESEGFTGTESGGPFIPEVPIIPEVLPPEGPRTPLILLISIQRVGLAISF